MVSFRERIGEDYKDLKRYYAATGFRMEFEQFIGAIWLISLLIGLIFSVLTNDILVSLIAFFAFNTLAIIIPMSLRSSRIEQIEENLPDALKHMSSILRAGGTTEDALEEISISEYGPLSADLKVGLMQLKEGKPFDDTLMNAALNSGSLLFKRTSLIIVDARKAGAGLADVMDAIAEDARDMNRIKRERYSRTTMPVMFLAISSLALAPFIFGFVLTIVCFIGSGLASADFGQSGTTEGISNLKVLLEVFIGIQALIAAVAIGIIREGKALKYITYSPFMIIISLAVFLAGQWIAIEIIGGGGMTC